MSVERDREIERKILKLYEKDATASHQRIATMLGVSEEEVSETVARLKKEKSFSGTTQS